MFEVKQKSKSRIYVKYMRLHDIDEVMLIEEEAYGEHHWSREAFVGELKNNLARYYIARDESHKITGYLGAWLVIDEAHITTLAVSTLARQKKIAQSLLNCFLEDCYANGIKYITLEVRESNFPAYNLYTKYGFKSLGKRKGYYQNNNEDAIIMWTENIWHEKFKLVYNQIVNANKSIEVYFEH